MRIQFVEKLNGPERLLCDAEIWFDEGALAGMKLVGFSVWRGAEGDVYVTFPSRAFGGGYDRKYFDYLRPVEPGAAGSRKVKDWILEEYRTATGQPTSASVYEQDPKPTPSVVPSVVEAKRVEDQDFLSGIGMGFVETVVETDDNGGF